MKQLFYSDFAKYYDKLYSYIDYQSQADFLGELFKKYKIPSKKLLDFACGTGKNVSLMKKMGFEVTGVDLSSEMIKFARKLYPNIGFYKGDMKTWESKEKFGVITILFNSILYNKNEKEFSQTLRNCYDQLVDGGILIFDTVDKSVGINSSKKVIGSADLSFAPQWIYNSKTNQLDLDIDFVIRGKKYQDHHIMGAFSLDKQRLLAEKDGFKVEIIRKSFDVSVENLFTIKRTYFICQKS